MFIALYGKKKPRKTPKQVYRVKPSKQRGCEGKANLGRSYVKQADKMSIKHGKQYGVYRCPHCEGTHLTTKLDKAGMYVELLYRTTGANTWKD
jgi:hypothetical protein